MTIMETKELLLKTAFCCMACDGEIAEEEIALIKKLTSDLTIFSGFDVESILNSYIAEINAIELEFFSNYLTELEAMHIDNTSALQIIDIALKTIEADNNIEYSEISFFKKIRAKLAISDEEILARYPNREDVEDFLLPDIIVTENQNWNFSFNNIDFAEISQ